MSSTRTARLDAMVEEATVDCYNEAEQVTGLFTMIEEHLAVPFETLVLGVQIVAVCVRGQVRQRIPLLDLTLPKPAPHGAEWIDAYRHWLGAG
jgi:hypothetical protein